MVELYDSAANVIDMNNDWRSTQEMAIQQTGLAPTDNREAAIVLRAIEQGARGSAADTPTMYLDLVGRLIDVTGGPAPQPAAQPSPLILP